MKKQNFTLVEMLVVIAIIGVLAGLLIPAVTKAREAAAATTCRNNFHQISSAVYTYAADNKGYLPEAGGNAIPNNPRRSGSMDGTIFVGVLDSRYIHSFVITKQNDEGTSFTVDKNKGGEVWLCPQIVPLVQALLTGDANRCGFFIGAKSHSTYHYDMFNRTQKKNRAEQLIHYKLDALKFPVPYSQALMVTEFCRSSRKIGNDTVQEAWKVIPEPHRNAFTVAWADGHVTQETPPAGYFLNGNPTSEKDKWVKK